MGATTFACSGDDSGTPTLNWYINPDNGGQADLAANDSSIDLMSLDVAFLAEFAHAGFLRPFDDDTAKELTDGVLPAPAESATWDGKLAAAPFWANTQLLWYRKSVV